MKIRELFFASALLLTASFCSCNENEVVTPSRGEQTQSIAFSISIPKGDPVTYVIHDEPEWTIESLWLLEFDANTNQLLAAPKNIKAQIKPTSNPAEYGYKHPIDANGRGSRRFVFVANEEPDIAVGDAYATLKTKLASKVLSTKSEELLNDFGGQLYIPMTGEAKQGNNPIIAVIGQTKVDVILQRIVARIDVENKVDNLIITDLKLRQTNSHSFLFEDEDIKVPSSNTKVSNIATFKPFTPLNGSQKRAKAFYLYEGHQRKENNGAIRVEDAVHVVVTGQLGGVRVQYNIPFWNIDEKKEIPVKRNHIYYLVLGEKGTPVKPGSNVKFTIKHNPWQEIIMNEPYDIITSSYSGSVGSFDEDTHTLSVDKNAHADLIFTFDTEFTDHTKYTATVLPKDNPPAWVSIPPFSGNSLTVQLLKNETNKERSVVIEIKSDADDKGTYKLLIKQAG